MSFQVGNSYGRIGSRGKANHTLLSERMREAFVSGAYKVWNKLLRAHFKDSETNYKARQYLFDQVIGRPKETIELEGGSLMQIDKAIILQVGKAYGQHQVTEGNGKAGNGRASI